jgi:hypothetical protein
LETTITKTSPNDAEKLMSLRNLLLEVERFAGKGF